MSYAQVIGAINALCHPRDRVVAAAGGLPAEVAANWRTLTTGSVDVEFGYSCMGYEIAGGWGARIAQMETEPERDTIVFTGDGSYLMMNSDIYSSVLSSRKLIIIVCDNHDGDVFIAVDIQRHATQRTHFGFTHDVGLDEILDHEGRRPLMGRHAFPGLAHVRSGPASRVRY